MPYGGTIFLTGATGLLGRDVLARLIAANPHTQFIVLVRDRLRWALRARGIPGADRCVTISGDVRRLDRDLAVATRRRLERHVTAVVHLAADTTFSRPLPAARLANVEGT